MSNFELIDEALNGIKVFARKKFEDKRGIFSKLLCYQELKEYIDIQNIAQINYSHNSRIGTVRGMHYQAKPYAETKLVSCVQGSVYDVSVDLRKDSPTFCEYFGIELSEKNNLSVLIPKGFAHGFQSIQSDSILIYAHDESFIESHNRIINPSDTKININWPLQISNISEKDNNAPFINDQFVGIKL